MVGSCRRATYFRLVMLGYVLKSHQMFPSLFLCIRLFVLSFQYRKKHQGDVYLGNVLLQRCVLGNQSV
jgi:hypothetical protein